MASNNKSNVSVTTSIGNKSSVEVAPTKTSDQPSPKVHVQYSHAPLGEPVDAKDACAYAIVDLEKKKVLGVHPYPLRHRTLRTQKIIPLIGRREEVRVGYKYDPDMDRFSK